MFHVAWGTVADAVEEAVAYGLAQQDPSAVTRIGLDEISRRRHHPCVTNVYGLKARRLVWSGDARTKAPQAVLVFDVSWPGERNT